MSDEKSVNLRVVSVDQPLNEWPQEWIDFLLKLEEKIVRFGHFNASAIEEVTRLKCWSELGYIDFVKKERSTCYIVLSVKAISDAHALRRRAIEMISRESLEAHFAQSAARIKQIEQIEGVAK